MCEVNAKRQIKMINLYLASVGKLEKKEFAYTCAGNVDASANCASIFENGETNETETCV
jgi:hypothetical protein